MKLGIVIRSNDSETVWNALRFGNLALSQKDEVNVFNVLSNHKSSKAVAKVIYQTYKTAVGGIE